MAPLVGPVRIPSGVFQCLDLPLDAKERRDQEILCFLERHVARNDECCIVRDILRAS